MTAAGQPRCRVSDQRKSRLVVAARSTVIWLDASEGLPGGLTATAAGRPAPSGDHGGCKVFEGTGYMMAVT